MSEVSTGCIVCSEATDLVKIEHGDADAPSGFSIPSGHQSLCFDCAKRLLREEKSCPFCRAIVWRIHPDNDASTPTPMEVDEYEGIADLLASPPATPARSSETPAPLIPLPEPVTPRKTATSPQQDPARLRETATSPQQDPARPRETPVQTTGVGFTLPRPIRSGECQWTGRRPRGGCKGPFYRSDVDRRQYCLGHLISGPEHGKEIARRERARVAEKMQKIARQSRLALRRLQADNDDREATVQIQDQALMSTLRGQQSTSPHPNEAQ